MRNRASKEIPLFNVNKAEVVKYYQFVYMFLLYMRKRPTISKRIKNATTEPTWGAAEIIYLALYGYTKKTKFSKAGQYIRWNKAPKSLEKRVMVLLGVEGKKYLAEQERKAGDTRQEAGATPDHPVNALSYEFRTDDIEVQRRMQRYIDDFDLHSSIDQDMLKNLVKTQMMVEFAQARMLRGQGTTYNVKELTDQIKSYVLLLGLSKKDRVDLGAERKKGSIAELASVYEDTLKEYPNLEHDFLVEELEMLLDKYDRLDNDGEREISAKTFKVVSGGYTLEEARDITGRKRKNVKSSKSRTSNS